jgi:homocysteine S-methyltransferase
MIHPQEFGNSLNNPLAPFLAEGGVVVLDGALATELERRGADLADPLWSAKLLPENPALIRQVHFDYFVAGADVATTASYQATLPGFARRGIDAAQGTALLQRSVDLACAARDEFWNEGRQREGRQRPLVAASIGPYGAYLADGSEYRGDYGLSVEALMDFHRPRLAILVESGADLLACETIPTLVEAEALVALLPEFPAAVAWLSFSCGDEQQLWHGESLRDAVALANGCEQVVAVGVNCTAPRLIEPLLTGVSELAAKPLLVYPNSGERWDAVQHCWLPGAGVTDFGEPARRWRQAGARLIGGCCRTTPDDIRAIARALGRSV